MKFYYRVENGQFVGFDKFQDGNNAEAIEFMNIVKTYKPMVRKVNYDVNSLEEELKQFEKLLHEKFKHIPRYAFNNLEVKNEITKKFISNGFDDLIISEFWKKLEEFKLDSVDKIFRNDNFNNWKDLQFPAERKEAKQFYSLMNIIIMAFEKRME